MEIEKNLIEIILRNAPLCSDKKDVIYIYVCVCVYIYLYIYIYMGQQESGN